jgi:hypothetical protein
VAPVPVPRGNAPVWDLGTGSADLDDVVDPLLETAYVDGHRNQWCTATASSSRAASTASSSPPTAAGRRSSRSLSCWPAAADPAQHRLVAGVVDRL